MARARTSSMLLLATVAMIVLAAITVSRGTRAAATTVKLTWFGQSAFALQSPAGAIALMDPVPAKLGYTMPRVKADVVTLSHEHFDHIALDRAKGSPKVLRGLKPNANDWNHINETVSDIRVRSVATYHDNRRGKERGLNTVFVFETGGLRIAHLGDLGHELDESQVRAIGKLDALLVPVGGTFTINAEQAAKVVDQLKPRRVVIPMHFKTKTLALDLPIATVAPFLKGAKNVRRLQGNSVELDLRKPPPSPEVILLSTGN